MPRLLLALVRMSAVVAFGLAVAGSAWSAGSLGISPAALDFGGQSLRTNSLFRTVTLANTGAAAITIASFGATPPFGALGACGTMAPGTICTLGVYFAPVSEGATTGLLSVTSTDGNATVPLTGLGERSLVTHYYHAILRREPDAPGKAFWEGEAARLQSAGGNVNEAWYAMAMAFFASAEYAAFNRDAGGYVTDLYNTFFARSPDAPGLAFWSGQVAAGMPREVVLAAFMFSGEFATFSQSLFGNAAVRREIDTVFDFYRGLLARLPDDAGLAYWIGRFRAAQCGALGGPAAQAEAISSAFAEGAEFAARNRSNPQFVGDLYNAFLRRGGDLPGVQFWISQLASGAMTRTQVRQAFVASPEFAQRLGQVAAAGCLPTIVSQEESTLAPLSALRLSVAGLDPVAPVTAEYRGPGGFFSSSEALKVDAGGMVTVAVPQFIDPATGRPAAGSASLLLRQGAASTNAVAVNLLDLPRASDYGMALGEPTRRFKAFEALLLGRRLGQLQAARISQGSDTAAAEATLRSRLLGVLQARDEVDRVIANNALVIAGGTTSAGNVVRMDRFVLESMDRLYLAFVADMARSLQPPVAPGAAQAKALPSAAEVLGLWEKMKDAKDAAGLVSDMQKAATGTNIVHYGKAAVSGVKEFLEKVDASEESDRFAKHLGQGLAIFDIGYASVDIAYDLGQLYLDTKFGGDPVALQQDLDRLEAHRIELLSASFSALTDGWVKVVPANTPGALNVAGVAVTTDLSQLMQSSADALVTLASRGVARQVVNPFPPRPVMAEVRVTATNLPPHGSLDLCCFGSAQILGMPDAGGSFSLFVPMGVAGVDYSSLTLRVDDVVAPRTLVSRVVDLRALSSAGPLLLPGIVVPRDCYAEYDACVAPCPVGGIAGIQCVNACLAALNACLGP